MFGLIKPAHVQMRKLLPPRLTAEFDNVLASADKAMPTYFDKGSRDRGFALIMGEWVLGKVRAGEAPLPPAMIAKVSHLIDLAERFNERGDGPMATACARDTIRAMYEAGWIPE